jgi:hypothetical protein
MGRRQRLNRSPVEQQAIAMFARCHRAEVEEPTIASFARMINGCLTCNGTKLLCGRCGNAENACRCGGAEEGDLMDCPDCKPPDFKLAVVQCERAIKLKAQEWPLRCFEISMMIAQAGLVPRGELRYGVYRGPVASKSPFYRRPISRHGWIEVPDKDRVGDGYVVDATRWVFTCEEPRIAVIGANSREFEQYDIGAEATNNELQPDQGPPQDADLLVRDGDMAQITTIRWPRVTHKFLDKHFGRHADLLLGQVWWLAHRSPTVLGSLAEPIYQTVIDAKLGGLVPIDYRQVVFKDRY